MTVLERFTAKVPARPTDGCWLWVGSTNGHGYGKFWFEGRIVAAHRVAVLLDGRIIPAGSVVMHTCDTPPCVRPDHLVIGSVADNQADCTRKGRRRTSGPSGKANGNARLTLDEVRQIRASDAAKRALARQFGVSARTIGRIIKGENWS